MFGEVGFFVVIVRDVGFLVFDWSGVDIELNVRDYIFFIRL